MPVKRSVLAALLLLGACAPFGAKEAGEHETDEAPLSQGKEPAPAPSVRGDVDASTEEPEAPEAPDAGVATDAGTTDEPKKPDCNSVIGVLLCWFD